ncbi:MAG: DNA polymerase III, subunit gamma and tau, partial [Methylotenera sp.]
TDPQKVPVTVLSRCLQFNLRQMAGTSIVSHLQNILGQEGIQYESTALHLIARAADGSMRDALSLTDQAIAYGSQTVNEKEVRAMLGAIDQSYLYQLLEALLAGDGAALLAQAKMMDERSIAFEAALNDFAQVLHQIAIAQTVPETVADDLPERDLLLSFAQRIPAETLQLYYQIALLGRRDIGLAPDEYAGFTMSLLRMLAFTPTDAVANNPAKKTAATPKVLAEKTVDMAPAKATVELKPAEEFRSSLDTKPAPAPSADEINISDTDITPVEQATHAESGMHFNGNWRGLVDELKLGLARELAKHCELISYDEHTIS